MYVPLKSNPTDRILSWDVDTKLSINVDSSEAHITKADKEIYGAMRCRPCPYNKIFSCFMPHCAPLIFLEQATSLFQGLIQSRGVQVLPGLLHKGEEEDDDAGHDEEDGGLEADGAVLGRARVCDAAHGGTPKPRCAPDTGGLI